jgi:hypothetical protein
LKVAALEVIKKKTKFSMKKWQNWTNVKWYKTANLLSMIFRSLSAIDISKWFFADRQLI